MRITRAQFRGLDQYKYSGVDKSIVSRLILGPFWNWLVTCFPKTLAPNTITFLGLCFVFANIGTMMVFDPTYSGKELPSWVYVSWSFGLFAYQSMDAIDGKQARRVGMASALGEMFDHGCDAINTTLEVVLCAHALGLTRSWWIIASQAASHCNFYASTWEEFHTGTLYLSAFSGPVEGILMICVVYLITATHPQGIDFWKTPLAQLAPGDLVLGAARWLDNMLGLKGHMSLAGLPMNVAFMMIGAFGTFGNIINSYWNIVIARRKAGKPIVEPLLGYLPLLAHSMIILLWLQAELRGGVALVHDARLLPFLGYWGMSFSYQVSQLILAHVTKSPFPYWNGMMVFSLFGALDANAKWLFNREPLVQASPVAANVFIWMSFFVALLNYVRFAREVIWQITEHTGIACFTVRHKNESGQWVENGELKDR